MKWRKYELMDRYGLCEIKYLDRTIRRYRWNNQSQFIAELREAVIAADETGRLNGNRSFFVTKLIPPVLSILLPNVRVHQLADISAVERAIEGKSSEYQEIWLCETKVGVNALSVAGRLLLTSSDRAGAQTIEQVWRCSPRLIENLGPSFPFPFVRASRFGWGWSPHLEYIYIPKSAPETENVIRTQFASALVMLDQAREKIQLFAEAVGALGLALCLEYKIEGDDFQIIDWDTSNDALVISALLPHEP